jgi:hypothetical protein
MKLGRRQFLHLATPSERKRRTGSTRAGRRRTEASSRYSVAPSIVCDRRGAWLAVQCVSWSWSLWLCGGRFSRELQSAKTRACFGARGEWANSDFSGFGFSFASKATTAPFDLMMPAPSTAPPHARGLLFHGFILISSKRCLSGCGSPCESALQSFCPRKGGEGK